MPRIFSFAVLALMCLPLASGCGKKDDSEPGGGGGGGGGSPDGQPVMLTRTADDKKEAVKRLRQIGAAMHNYEATMGFLPAGVVGEKGQLGLSWRVLLLPYLDEGKLYEEFKQNEPWDSAHNKKLVARMPKVFEAPGTVVGNGKTYLRSFVGPMAFIPGAWPGGPKGAVNHSPWANQMPGMHARGRSIVGIPDGTSNTLMVAEAAEPVEWTKPDDLPFPDLPGPPQGERAPLPKLGGLFDGGFHGLMCDGLVHFFPSTLPEQDVRRLIAVSDGEVLGPEVNAILAAAWADNGKKPAPGTATPPSKGGTTKTYGPPK